MASSSPIVASSDTLRALASEVFILGYPLVLTDLVRRAHPVGAGQILLLPDDPRGIAPGFDGEDVNTVLTSAWIDLEPGPVVFHVPDPRGRHFTLTLVDAAGEIIASFGPPSGHADGGEFAIVGRNWSGDLAPGLTVVSAPPGPVWVVTRITASSTEDRSLARLLASRQRLGPLDAVTPKGDTAMLTLDAPATSCIQHLLEMTPEAFLHRLGMLLGRLRSDGEDDRRGAIRTALAALQDAAQQTEASAETRHALLRGLEDGFAAIRGAADPAAGPLGEWRVVGSSDADTPLARAAQAFSALGAPAVADVLTLACCADETGRPLHGSERYRIHFPPGETPPVDAFWSITVSPGGRGHDRTSLGSRDTLAFTRDGSLDVILQPTWPGTSHASNWLSTPERAFGLTLKLYGPRLEALGGAWRVPSVERLGSRFARRGADAGRTTPNASDPGPHKPARGLPGLNNSMIEEIKSMRTYFVTAGVALAAALAAGAATGQPAAPAKAPAAATGPAAEPKLDPEALQALKRMSAYLGTLKMFELTADSTIDLVMDDGEKIQQSGITTYKVRRPDGLVVETAWDRKARQFIYDGKKLTIYAPKLGFYAQADAPSTIRETLAKVEEKYGISLPLEDLFYWSETGDRALAPPDEGYYVGVSTQDGVETDQYAFRDGDLDWQIWIEKDDTPVPRKMVIIDRSDEARPEFSARLKWNTDPKLDAATFAFKPDANARAIKLAGN